jgi:hypothetical protein
MNTLQTAKSIEKQDELAGATDQQRAAMIEGTKDAPETKTDKPDENLVKAQMKENEQTDQAGELYSSVCEATHAAQDACRKLIEEGSEVEPAFRETMTDLIATLQEMADEKDPIAKIYNDKKAHELP